MGASFANRFLESTMGAPIILDQSLLATNKPFRRQVYDFAFLVQITEEIKAESAADTTTTKCPRRAFAIEDTRIVKLQGFKMPSAFENSFRDLRDAIEDPNVLPWVDPL